LGAAGSIGSLRYAAAQVGHPAAGRQRCPLGPEWRDHPLKGDWAGFRECHIGGDFLLIYQVDDTAGKSGMVDFVRAGTHSELFNE